MQEFSDAENARFDPEAVDDLSLEQAV